MTADLMPPGGGDGDGDDEIKGLVEQIEQILSAVPPEQRDDLFAQITQIRFHQGPLPPPSMLAQYGEIVPDLPERIVALVEREQTLAQ